MEAMVEEKSSEMDEELWSPPESSPPPLCRSEREGVELMSDRAGDRVLERSVSDPGPSFLDPPPSLLSPSEGEVAVPVLSESPCCLRRLRRYLARAFWNHT
jgi:hypothetical protein